MQILHQMFKCVCLAAGRRTPKMCCYKNRLVFNCWTSRTNGQRDKRTIGQKDVSLSPRLSLTISMLLQRRSRVSLMRSAKTSSAWTAWSVTRERHTTRWAICTICCGTNETAEQLPTNDSIRFSSDHPIDLATDSANGAALTVLPTRKLYMGWHDVIP